MHRLTRLGRESGLNPLTLPFISICTSSLRISTEMSLRNSDSTREGAQPTRPGSRGTLPRVPGPGWLRTRNHPRAWGRPQPSRVPVPCRPGCASLTHGKATAGSWVALRASLPRDWPIVLEQRAEKPPLPGRWPGLARASAALFRVFAMFWMCWHKVLTCTSGGPVLGKVVRAAVKFY